MTKCFVTYDKMSFSNAGQAKSNIGSNNQEKEVSPTIHRPRHSQKKMKRRSRPLHRLPLFPGVQIESAVDTVQHTIAANLPLLYILFGLAGTLG